jgi:transposase
MRRYYIGVDWADKVHAVWVGDEVGTKVVALTVPHTAGGLSELGRWLYEWQAEEIELWAAIERPEGRLVDFLLDHGVTVYPINPKALDRARDRFRMSQAKSDPFDARVLAEFLRTDHSHLRSLLPNSEPAQELKLLTRDYQRLVRQQTRLLNQLTVTLKDHYPRPLELFEDLATPLARAFLEAFPTPEASVRLTHERWQDFARVHRLNKEHVQKLWEILKEPQLPIPAHVVRAKARLVNVLVKQLGAAVSAVNEYRAVVEDFFAALPAAEWARTLPGGKSGTIVPTLWAELGDATGRWQSFHHLQAQSGTVPVTACSGKTKLVRFRFACSANLRYAAYWLAFISLRQSEWAKAYYQQQRALGHRHPRALRALGAKWLKIIFVMWRDHIPYDENYHLANMTRYHLRQAA